MPRPQDGPTDLEWFRAQELSPDDLDEDTDRPEGPATIRTDRPPPEAVPPESKP